MAHLDELLFWLFAATAVGSGLLAISRKNAVASAVWLVVLFFGLAGTFVLLEAYFVAAVQILVYAGAIMVLFLFVIMLLDLRSGELKAHAGPRLKIPGILLSAAFLWAVVTVVRTAASSPAVADRVSAVLEMPAPKPPPPDPTKPLEIPAAPPAPPPVAVEMTEPRREDIRVTDDFLPAFTGEGNLAKARVRQGTVRIGPEDRAGHLFLVALLPEGQTLAFLDRDGDRRINTAEIMPPEPNAEPNPTPTPAEARTETIRLPVALPFQPPTIVLTVQRGGLDAYAGGAADGSPRGVGRSLFDDWILPFEVTSVLLLGAIFGAVVLTKRRLT